MERLIIMLLLMLPSALVFAAWPTYQGNTSHTGYVPVEMDSANFSLRWEASLGTGLNPVTTSDGKVFVTQSGYFTNQNLFVLDDNSGAILWQHNFGDIYSLNPPAYYDNKVYVQSGNHSSDTYLRAFDVDNGDLVFQSAHAAQWERYLAPTIHDGTVYVNGGYYGGMYAFDAQDGLQRWFTGLPQYDGWTPAVDDTYAYAYTGGVFSIVNKATGTISETVNDANYYWSGYTMNLAPVLGGANDAFVINGQRLIRVNLNPASIDYEIDAGFTGQPSLAKGVIYAISSNSLVARDQLTGALLWSWIPTGAEKLTSPMIVTDSYVLISSETSIYAVNLKTHTEDWSYPASGQLALNNNVLYVANKINGVLTTLNMGPPPDQDQDGITDGNDNCPTIYNPSQNDTDLDGLGDACNDAVDTDGDEWSDTLDNCPATYNPDQANIDGDEFGDVCDPYPTEIDNLGFCLGTVAENEMLINQLLEENADLITQLVDSDGDGMIDLYDTCSDSIGEVDQTGCTQQQFCEIVNSKKDCHRADWKNDESGSARDCRWSDNQCSAR